MMLSTFLAISTVLTVSFAAPNIRLRYTNVKWIEMEKAETTERHLAQTEFDNMEKEWQNYKRTYEKSYESITEELHRFSIFRENLRYIINHNKEYNNGNKTYYLGIHHLADLEWDEYLKLAGNKQPNNGAFRTCSTYHAASDVVLPDRVDWRDKGYVTPVKNQGMCGSCWSFSATGSLEGQHYRKTGKLVSLSEQQLIDCSTPYGNAGCKGGYWDESFEYIKYTGGIMSEKTYPYTYMEGQCKAQPSEFVASVTGCVNVTSGSESALKQAVSTQGPISVGIDAHHQSFQLYEGGVYNEPWCSSTYLSHAVLVVGYGTGYGTRYGMDGADYWIVKNSWGTWWGNDGYILMSRNKNNQCGIATRASYPLV